MVKVIILQHINMLDIIASSYSRSCEGEYFILAWMPNQWPLQTVHLIIEVKLN